MACEAVLRGPSCGIFASPGALFLSASPFPFLGSPPPTSRPCAQESFVDWEADIDKEIKAAIAAAEDTDAVLAIAPRKPNWDLKRDVERKMLTLASRTDRAVVQLIRQRIKKDEGGEEEK